MLSAYSRSTAIEQLIKLEERHFLVLTEKVANTLWPRYNDFLKKAESIPTKELVEHPLSITLRRDFTQMVHGLPVLKIKLFDTKGRTLFSTDSSQTGKKNPASYPSNKVAFTGELSSKISDRKTFRTIDDKMLYDRKVLSSYLPVRAVNENKIIGVIELYTDLTRALAGIESKQREVIAVVLLILGLLYVVLYLFVTRADRIMIRQHDEHKQATELSSRFGRLLDRSSNEIYIFDAKKYLFTHVNQGACENLGYSLEELKTMCPWQLKLDFSRDKFLSYIEPLGVGELEQLNFETIHERKDGSTYPVDVRLQLASEADPPVYIAMILDIGERKQAEIQLRKLSSAIEQSPNTVVITDTDNKIEYVNRKFSELTGFTSKEVLGQEPVLWWSKDTPDIDYDKLWQMIKAGEEWSGEIKKRKKDGSNYWAAESVSALRSENGDLTNFIYMQQDITDRKYAEDRLNYLAYYDSLTGLPNRRLFSDRLQQAMKDADRNKKVVGLLFVDLDQFKKINDSLGHSTGDLLLSEAGIRLQGCVRAHDTVARLGGDEFSLVLCNMDNTNNAIDVAQKIIRAFSKPFHIRSLSLFVTASIGIIMYPDDANSVDGLLKNADIAMYHAKDVGRNNFQFYSNDMTAKLEERLMIEGDLRQALKNEEFILVYQPQVDLTNGAVVGMEALIRWQHPQNGMIAPDRFIGIAEETGLIIPVGEWVLREACQQNRNLINSGYSPIRVSVNLSTRQLSEPNLVEVVDQALKDFKLDPALLELEITESMLMSDVDRVTNTLENLSALGVSISVDDFGTGYSSLAYLKRFPISALKIDRSFIMDIPEDKDDVSITCAIINMAAGLGIKTIAEGVETKEQLEFLKTQKCDLMQGYYFCKPITFNEIVKLLDNKQINSESMGFSSLSGID